MEISNAVILMIDDFAPSVRQRVTKRPGSRPGGWFHAWLWAGIRFLGASHEADYH